MTLPGFDSLKFHLTHLLGLRPRYDFGVISIRPLILYTHYDDALWPLLQSLRRFQLHCFITCFWSLTVTDQQAIALRIKQWMQTHPHHHIEHLAPSATELAVLQDLGIPGALCSQNCLVDERTFKVDIHAPKRFRAIYDGRLTPFKRHYLASQVADLALITYDIPLDRDERYLVETQACLKQATWLNGPFSSHHGRFSSAQISQFLNQSRVGLILSELEGANYASIQYLLCGLPVVTTRNQGGRDTFFHPDYVIWADDTPESVAAAVNELIARNIPPDNIRSRTLDLVKRHRAELTTLIARASAPAWETYFRNKLLKEHSNFELRRLKLKARFGLK